MTLEELTASGNLAFEAGDFQAAVDLFEEAYQLEQTLDLNHALVKSLDQSEQYAQAYRIATELPWHAYESRETQELFINVALHAEQPIAARKMLARYVGNPDDMLQGINQVEQQLRVEQSVKVKTLTREFYHLGEASLVAQQQRLQEYDQLPLDEYVFGAKGVLMDPFAHALTRATVFASLQALQYEHAIDMLNVLGETETIVPAKVKKLEKMTSYQTIQKEFIEQETQMDPIMWQGLVQQNQLMLQIMYPFIDEVIDAPVDWLVNLQDMMMGQSEGYSATKQGRWQEKTMQSMVGIFGF